MTPLIGSVIPTTLTQQFTQLELNPDEKESFLLDLIDDFAESETIRNLPYCELRVFAHIFGDKWIGGSNLEGSNLDRNLSFLIPVLYEILRDSPYEDLHRLIKDLEELKEWDNRIEPSFYYSNQPDEIRREILIDLQAKIRNLNEDDYFLIPGTWKTIMASHQVIYKIGRSKNGYYFTLYNSGFGLEYHPNNNSKYNTNITQTNVSLDSLSSLGFLSTLIYGLYFFCGTGEVTKLFYNTLMPMLGGFQESDLAIVNMPHLAGLCSMGCIKAYMYGSLDSSTVKPIRFKTKFLSLAKHYSNAKKSDSLSSDEKIILKAARNSLGRSVLKMKERFPSQENDHNMVLAYALMKAVDLLLEKPTQPLLAKISPISALIHQSWDVPATIEDIPTQPKVISQDGIDEENKLKVITSENSGQTQIDLTSPEAFVNSLAACVTTLTSVYPKSFKTENRAEYAKFHRVFCQIIDQIPIPTPDDSYYDDGEFTPELSEQLRKNLMDILILCEKEIILQSQALAFAAQDEKFHKFEVSGHFKPDLRFFIDEMLRLYHVYAVLTAVVRNEISFAIPKSRKFYGIRDGFFSDLFSLARLSMPVTSIEQRNKIKSLEEFFSSIEAEDESEILCFNYNNEPVGDVYANENNFLNFRFKNNLNSFADATLLQELYPRGDAKTETIHREYLKNGGVDTTNKFLEHLYVKHYPPFLKDLRAGIFLFRKIFTSLDTTIAIRDLEFESLDDPYDFYVQTTEGEPDEVNIGPNLEREDLSPYVKNFRKNLYTNYYISFINQKYNYQPTPFENVLLSWILKHDTYLSENDIITRTGSTVITHNFGDEISYEKADRILQKVQEFLYAEEFCFSLALDYYHKEFMLLSDSKEGNYHRFIVNMLFFKVDSLRKQFLRNAALIKQLIQFCTKIIDIYGLDTTADSIHCFIFDLLNQIRNCCIDILLRNDGKEWNAIENLGLRLLGLLSKRPISDALGMKILDFYDKMQRPWNEAELSHIITLYLNKQGHDLTNISVFEKLEKIWSNFDPQVILNQFLGSHGVDPQHWTGDFPLFTGDQGWIINLHEIKYSHSLRHPDHYYFTLPTFLYFEFRNNRSRFHYAEDGTLNRELPHDCVLVIHQDKSFKVTYQGTDYFYKNEQDFFLKKEITHLSKSSPSEQNLYFFTTESDEKMLAFSCEGESFMELKSQTVMDKNSIVISTEKGDFQLIDNDKLAPEIGSQLKQLFKGFVNLSLFIDPLSKKLKHILFFYQRYESKVEQFIVSENRIVPEKYSHLELVSQDHDDIVAPLDINVCHFYLKDKNNNYYFWIFPGTSKQNRSILTRNEIYISSSILFKFDPSSGKIQELRKDSFSALISLLRQCGEYQEALNLMTQYAGQVKEKTFFELVTVLVTQAKSFNPADCGFRMCCLALACTFVKFKIGQTQTDKSSIKELCNDYKKFFNEIPLSLRPKDSLLPNMMCSLGLKDTFMPERSSHSSFLSQTPAKSRPQLLRPEIVEQRKLWDIWKGDKQLQFTCAPTFNNIREDDEVQSERLFIHKIPLEGDSESEIAAVIFNTCFQTGDYSDNFILNQLLFLIKSVCSQNTEIIFQAKFTMYNVISQAKQLSKYGDKEKRGQIKLAKLILFLTAYLPPELKPYLPFDSTDPDLNTLLNILLGTLRQNPEVVEGIFNCFHQGFLDSGKKPATSIVSTNFLPMLASKRFPSFIAYEEIPFDLLQRRYNICSAVFEKDAVTSEATCFELDDSAPISAQIYNNPVSRQLFETMQKSLHEYHLNPPQRFSLKPCKGDLLIDLIKQFQDLHNQLSTELAHRIHSFKNDLELSHSPGLAPSIWCSMIHKNGEDLLKDIATRLLSNAPSDVKLVLTELNNSPERTNRAIELLVIAVERDHLKRSIESLGRVLKKHPADSNDYSAKQLNDISNYLGPLLLNQRAFEPKEYPQGVAFEYLCGVILRPNQYQKLREIKFDSSTVIQLMMGEGKSAVINPSLALLAAGHGFLPFMIVPPSLKQQSLRDLHNIIGPIGQRPILNFEFGRDTQVSSKSALKLYNLLVAHLQSKGLVLTTPSALQDFLLKYKEMTFISPQKQKLLSREQLNDHLATRGWFAKIFDLMMRYGIAFGDEAHWIFRSLQEVYFTIGERVQLPQVNLDLSLFFHFHLAKYQYDFDQSPYSLLQKGSWTDMESILATAFIDEYCGEMDEEFKTDLYSYLLCRDESQNQFIENVYAQDPEKADLYALASMQIIQFLPHTLSRIYGVDFGKSKKSDKKFAVPYDGKDNPSVNGEFGHIDVMLNLTARKYFLEGLNLDEFKDWVLFVKDKILRAVSNCTIDSDDYNAKMELSRRYFLDLDPCAIQTENQSVIKALCLRYGKDINLIHRYLTDYLFPKFTQEFVTLNSTPSDIGDLLFKSVIATTGSPYNSHAYPLPLSQTTHKPNIDSGRLLARLLQAENSKCTTLPDENIQTHFLEHISRTCQEQKVGAIIDLGAFFRGLSNLNVAKRLLDMIPHVNAILFFDDHTQEKMAIQRGQHTPDSSIVSSLSSADYAVYYDQRHCFGADFELDLEAHGVVSVHNEAACFQFFQAVKRERNLEQSQTISTVISESFFRGLKQQHNCELIRTRELLLTGIVQESDLVEKEIIASIPKKMEHQIRKDLFKLHLKQLQQTPLPEELFVKKQNPRPYQLYGLKSGMISSGTWVDQISQNYQAVVDKYKLQPELETKQRIGLIAEAAKQNLPPQINGLLNQDMDQEVEKQKEMHVEMEQTQNSFNTQFIYREKTLDIVSLFYEPVSNISYYIVHGKEHALYKVTDFPWFLNSDLDRSLFSPDLLMSENFLRTTTVDSINAQVPIKKAHFLVEVRRREGDVHFHRFIILSIREIKNIFRQKKTALQKLLKENATFENTELGLGIYTLDNFSVLQIGKPEPALREKRKEILTQLKLFNTESTVEKKTLAWVEKLPTEKKQGYQTLMKTMEPMRRNRQNLMSGNVFEKLYITPAEQALLKRRPGNEGNQAPKRVKVSDPDLMEVDEAIDLWESTWSK